MNCVRSIKWAFIMGVVCCIKWAFIMDGVRCVMHCVRLDSLLYTGRRHHTVTLSAPQPDYAMWQ